VKVYTANGDHPEKLHVRAASEDRAAQAAVAIMAYLSKFDEPERIFFIDTDDVAMAPFAVLSVEATPLTLHR
jgi:exonuclease I